MVTSSNRLARADLSKIKETWQNSEFMERVRAACHAEFREGGSARALAVSASSQRTGATASDVVGIYLAAAQATETRR